MLSNFKFPLAHNQGPNIDLGDKLILHYLRFCPCETRNFKREMFECQRVFIF